MIAQQAAKTLTRLFISDPPSYTVLEFSVLITKLLFQNDLLSPDEDISEYDERINTFWQNTRNDYHFIIEKNREYLNWRYCDLRSNLKGRYFVKQAEQNGEILGFIVIETRRKEDYSEGYIVDLLALPDRVDVVRKLLLDACLFF